MKASPRWERVSEKQFIFATYGFVGQLNVKCINSNKNGTFYKATISRGSVIHTVVKARTFEEAVENARTVFMRGMDALYPPSLN